jgi:hypothetical protein
MAMSFMPRSRAALTAVATLTVGTILVGCTTNPPWWVRRTTTTRSTTTRPTTPTTGPSTGEVGRDADGVVVTGSQVGSLNGAQPGRVVAFRAEAGSWVQIPVQVDERVDTTFHQIYGLPAGGRIAAWSTVNLDLPVNAYADPTTFTGPDTDPAVDADDEIVFMARDAGGSAGDLAAPAGTDGGGAQVKVTDPIDGTSSYAYLFRSDGSLDPGAGQKYVDYQFRLDSGDYKTTYKRQNGPNPENSVVTGDTYKTHFGDRWLQDEVYLTRGDRPTRDLMDRMKYQINLVCARNENTFDNDEGAFVVNKSGPVRALRSYMGSNSGPLTQNTHVFYDKTAITRTELRVHGIPNVGAAVNLSREAVGMTFRNPQVPGGVTIDGQPDNVPTNAVPTWWTYSGAQGGLAVSTTFDVDATQPASGVYEDNFNGSANAACSGSRESIGHSGAHFNSWIQCTDPGSGCTNHLRSEFRLVATPGSTSPADLQKIGEQGLKPLTVAVSGY